MLLQHVAIIRFKRSFVQLNNPGLITPDKYFFLWRKINSVLKMSFSNKSLCVFCLGNVPESHQSIDGVVYTDILQLRYSWQQVILNTLARIRNSKRVS